MSKLITISNRLPISVVKRAGKLQFNPSIGGLVTGLSSFYKSRDSVWVGWPGISSARVNLEEEKEINERLTAENCHPIFLSKYEVENYYHGFSNKTIWPLFHYFPQYTTNNNLYWDVYKRVNEKFSNVISNLIEPGDEIWIHDYQLLLLPSLIRKKNPGVALGFFLHIPFPTFEIFRLLPWREEVLEGILGADLIAFHTCSYVNHFLNNVRRLLGYEYDRGQLLVENRVVKVEPLSMGIDYNRYAAAVETPTVQKKIAKIKKKLTHRKIILTVDRLDYTKGIVERLEAYELFLEKNPKYLEKVTLITVAVPSRTSVDTYVQLKKQVDELVGRVNGRYGTFGWAPIWYLYRSLSFEDLVAYYHLADVCLVTPLRDGMNLVSKEFIACKTNGQGVLILSEMAGAAKELGESLIVNPNNKEQVAGALVEALEMPEEEKLARNEKMQQRLRHYTVTKWANLFLKELRQSKINQQELSTKLLSPHEKEKLILDYRKNKKRLVLLDYDGTLVQFSSKPLDAKPDDQLIKLIENLACLEENEVVIISGRDRITLGNFFSTLKISLVAEHGAWIKEKGQNWYKIEPLRDDWKEEIMPVVERYLYRMPGSFIEEKDFSIAFHYRKTDPDLARERTKELKDDLLNLTVNLNLAILEGNMVVEIRDSTINKGRAALQFITKRKQDFCLAIGDDATDEDTFAALPESAYSIKVGLSPSQAKFSLKSVAEVRSLLIELERS